MCWIEPCDIDDETFDEIEESFRDANIKMSEEEYKVLFAAWAMEIMTSEYAIGSEIDDDVRLRLTPVLSKAGIEDETVLALTLRKCLKLRIIQKIRLQLLRRVYPGIWHKALGTSSKYFELGYDYIKI